MYGDHLQYRLNATDCLRAAQSATSLETREEFTGLAHIWLRRAARFENDNALLGESKEYVAPPRWAV